MKFGEIQSALKDGKCVARKSWSDFPHKAFYAKQIGTVLIVDCNNKVMQSELFECQIMADDWYVVKENKNKDEVS